MNKEIRFYQNIVLTWLLLLIYPPIGIILLWKIGHYDIFTRIIISLFFSLLFLELQNIYSSFIRALIFAIIIIFFIYRYHKIKSYIQIGKDLINYALNHLEIQKILTNYLTKYSSPTNNFQDCLLFEIYLQKKFPIIHKYFSLIHLEETYINIIYFETKYLINYKKVNKDNLLEILEKQEKINNNYLQKLIQIKKIISPILKLKGDKFSIYFTFIILKKFSITFYANKFKNLFEKEFTNITDLDNIIYQYISIASLNTNKNSLDIAMFTYYLINKKILNNQDFYEGIEFIHNKLQIQTKKHQENLFKKQLYYSNNELLTEIKTWEIIEEMKTKERFILFSLNLLNNLGYFNISSPLNKYLDYIVKLNNHQFGINIVFQNNNVKLNKEHINNLIAGLKYNQINKGIIITNYFFTDEALTYGEKNNIILWDRNEIKQKVQAINSLKYNNEINFEDISPIPFNKISIKEIDNMTKFEFKYFIIEFYKRKGYKIKEIFASSKEDIDLIIEKNGLVFGILIKNDDKTINEKTIKNIIALTNYYKLNTSIVITNNYFSKEAIALAHKCNITLLDRKYLINETKKALGAF